MSTANAENNTEQLQTVNPLEMSSSEFEALDLNDVFPRVEETGNGDDKDVVPPENGDAPNAGNEEAAADKVDGSEDGGDADLSAQSKQKSEGEEAGAESQASNKETAGDENSDPELGDTGNKDNPEPDTNSVEYKASQFDRLLEPFTANGKKIKVDNIDEAVQLMQMGANYNKKMYTLKPALKSIKLLEKHGLLDEDKLNFLVDVAAHKPAAIQQLLKDSKIHPNDINVDEETDYKPASHQVSDAEIELDNVLDDLKSSPKYADLMDVVTTQWDEESKRTIGQAPAILSVIDSHMNSGVYDVITAEVDKQRTLGQLKGMTDIQAYQFVGDAIQARNGFDHLFSQKGQGQQAPSPQKKANTAEQEAARNAKRKAASPAKSSAPSKNVPQRVNPLALSSEEFAKLSPKFL